MSVKNLEVEFKSLKNEFTDLKSKIDILVKKYENLEKKYEKSLSKKKNINFKCKTCDEKFGTVKELQNHKESCAGTYQCEECDKCFTEESKLDEHMKKHEKFPCDECDKVYDYEGTLEKHKSGVHEDFEIFCHFFNNNKDCPFDDQCIYLHEESDNCKYGKSCERILCMFKHEECDDGDDSENENDSEEDEDEESVENLKPVLKKIQEAVEKFDVLLKKCSLRCDQCEFEAKNQNGLNMHVKSKHTKQ